MELRTSEKFTDFAQQRELLISGQFNTLFNDLSFNLPHRFLAYANPDYFNYLLKNLYKNL
jgi:hypothetical protein